MTNKTHTDGALSLAGLRVLAMYVVKDIDTRIPATRFADFESRERYLEETINLMHRALVGAHAEMAREGVRPRQRVKELTDLGRELADEEVTMLKAYKRATH
jgi:hypothetical protein